MKYDEIVSRFSAGQQAASELSQALATALQNSELFGGDACEINEHKDRLREILHGLQSELEEPTYRIAVVGGFSGGKSTLINELLGVELLSENVNPTTANVTVIRKAKAGAEQKMILRYMEQDQFERYTREGCGVIELDYDSDVTALLASASSKLDKFRALVDDPIHGGRGIHDKIRQVEDLIELLSGYKQNQSLIGTKEERTLDANLLNEWTAKAADKTNGELALIREVELRIHSDFLDDYTALVDLPGTDSTRLRDTRIAYDYIPTVDAVIVASMVKRPFADEDMAVMQLLRAQKASIQNKLFFVLSQMDMLNSGERKQLDQTYKTALRNLNESFRLGNPDYFFLTSAYVARAIRYRSASTGEAVSGDTADALRGYREQADAFRHGGDLEYPEGVRELMRSYYKDGGGLTALRTALMEHFRERSMQDKIRDAAARLKAVHSQLDRVVAPVFASVRNERETVRERAMMLALDMSRDCERYVAETLRSGVLFEDLSVSNCANLFREHVTDRIADAIAIVVQEFPFKRLLGGEPHIVADLPRRVGDAIQERFFELLESFLDAAVYSPVNRRINDVSIEPSKDRGSLNASAHQLFREGSRPLRDFEHANVDYQSTTSICLRARAAEDIRGFYGQGPTLAYGQGGDLHDTVLEEFKSELREHFTFQYNSLAEGMRSRTRDYVIYCLQLFEKRLLDVFPLNKYIHEPEGVVDVERLIPGVSSSGAEVLEQLDGRLRGALSHVEQMTRD